MAKEYDYLLKVLLVGDSDVGKTEILNNLDDDLNNEEGSHSTRKMLKNFSKSLNFTSVTATYKTTIILLDGKRVKLQVSIGRCVHLYSPRNLRC